MESNEEITSSQVELPSVLSIDTTAGNHSNQTENTSTSVDPIDISSTIDTSGTIDLEEDVWVSIVADHSEYETFQCPSYSEEEFADLKSIYRMTPLALFYVTVFSLQMFLGSPNWWVFSVYATCYCLAFYKFFQIANKYILLETVKKFEFIGIFCTLALQNAFIIIFYYFEFEMLVHESYVIHLADKALLSTSSFVITLVLALLDTFLGMSKLLKISCYVYYYSATIYFIAKNKFFVHSRNSSLCYVSICVFVLDFVVNAMVNMIIFVSKYFFVTVVDDEILKIHFTRCHHVISDLTSESSTRAHNNSVMSFTKSFSPSNASLNLPEVPRTPFTPISSPRRLTITPAVKLNSSGSNGIAHYSYVLKTKHEDFMIPHKLERVLQIYNFDILNFRWKYIFVSICFIAILLPWAFPGNVVVYAIRYLALLCTCLPLLYQGDRYLFFQLFRFYEFLFLCVQIIILFVSSILVAIATRHLYSNEKFICEIFSSLGLFFFFFVICVDAAPKVPRRFLVLIFLLVIGYIVLLIITKILNFSNPSKILENEALQAYTFCYWVCWSPSVAALSSLFTLLLYLVKFVYFFIRYGTSVCAILRSRIVLLENRT